MKRAFLLFSVLFLQLNFIVAQNTITGTLIDSTNKEKLAFANVGLLRVSDSAFVSGVSSDDKGTFKLTHVPNGKFNLIISSIGYETFKKTLDVSGDLNLGILKLQPGAVTLDEVVITEKKPLFANEGEKTLYNVKEDPSVQTGTASDALQNAPGVEVDVEGNVTLRGVSTVEIWINDQPSHLNAENLKTYLQQLPANAIEKIEVITNPSARYASKSDGGIINIVTTAKVQKNEFVSFGFRASTSPNISPWASYVWANEKISINAYINCNYGQWRSKSNGYSTSFRDGENPAVLDTTSHRTFTSNSESNNYGGGFYLSFQYNIDTMNNMSVWMGGWPWFSSSSANEEVYRHEFINNPSIFHYANNSNEKNNNISWNGGLDFMHKFNNKGHNITFSLNGNLNNSGFGDNTSSYSRHYEEQTWLNTDYRTKSIYGDFGYGAEINYNIPYIKNGEIGLGVAYSHDPDNYSIDYDTLSGDEYLPHLLKSFDRISESNNYDAYFTIQHKFGKLIIKPGIRLEYENIFNNIKGYDEFSNSKDYLNWRPSLHLSYRTKKMHNFKLNYTRRISNPNARYITEFIDYDEESFSTGNLDLEPTFTNSFEGGWTKYWEKFGSIGITAYYRGSTNTVNNVTDVIFNDYFGRIVSFSQPVNIGKTYNAGGEFNITYRPNAMFNMRLYANVYDSYYETDYKDNKVTDEKLIYSVRLNMWTKIYKKYEIHASGYYRSPSQSLYAERKANYALNCGVRADFFDRKLSVFVNANDIFNWNKSDNNTTNPYYISYSSRKYNSRTVSLGVVLRFGKMELEKSAKIGGTEESIPQ